MKKRFNLKRLLSKRNSSGFTLIEVVIAMLLLGILVTGVITFASPILNLVKNNKNSAQATMLAEAIDTYIASALENAERVELWTNASVDSAKGEYGVSSDSSGGYLNIRIWMEGKPTERELRCIALRWADDESGVDGRKKLMLYNCIVDNDFSGGSVNHLQILDEFPVFDASLYSNLYPIVTLDTYSHVNADGSTGFATNGYKVTTKVYSNINCYNTLSVERGKATPLFEGVEYIECPNMIRMVGGKAERYPASPARSLVGNNVADPQPAIDAYKTGKTYTEGESNYFYPDTIIYYVVPKPTT